MLGINTAKRKIKEGLINQLDSITAGLSGNSSSNGVFKDPITNKRINEKKLEHIVA